MINWSCMAYKSNLPKPSKLPEKIKNLGLKIMVESGWRDPSEKKTADVFFTKTAEKVEKTNTTCLLPRKWTNVPRKGTSFERNFIFQPSVFGGCFSFQGYNFEPLTQNRDLCHFSQWKNPRNKAFVADAHAGIPCDQSRDLSEGGKRLQIMSTCWDDAQATTGELDWVEVISGVFKHFLFSL